MDPVADDHDMEAVRFLVGFVQFQHVPDVD